ncbi:MAG: M28 family peptidase [Candidatus Krumholzibacteriia bacterium]
MPQPMRPRGEPSPSPRVLGFALVAVLGAAAAHATPIAPARLRAHVEFLAHDQLEGRGAGTRGLQAAGSYIAARFEEMGLTPAGDDDTFFQYFEVTTGVQVVGDNALRIGTQRLEVDQHWRPYGFSDIGSLRASLVFVGYGITAPEYDYDDYAQVDVEGKIALALALEPGQNDSTSVFEGTVRTVHSDLRTKAMHAREHRAAGLLVVIGPLSEVPNRLAPLKPETGYYPTGILAAHVGREALQQALPGVDLEAWQGQIDAGGRPASRGLENTEIDWTVSLEKKRVRLRNVVGLVPGADPHRAVVVGAHYDHLGMGGPGSLAPDADEPHNGADDNASGTSALIELARHFMEPGEKPAQTLLFTAFSGEEIGLAGSEHYVENPVYPMRFTSAMLNMDMLGRLRDRKLMVYGTDSATEFEELLVSLNEAGPRFDLRLKGDGYGPSDQMSFYKKDVPVLHFFTGAHSDYHKPSDDAGLLNYGGLAEVATFLARVIEALLQRELSFVDAPAPPSDTGVGGFRSYLGTIPDYGQPDDLEGVLLSDVRAESPAQKAGIQGGDIIVKIDDTLIHNIYDFVHVLRTRRPEEKVRVTVLRDDERLTLDATLAEHP